MYVELHAASAFSFLDGASLPEALVERAAELGYPALALLDRDGVYGAPRFHLAAKRAGLKAIIGAELTLAAVRGPGSGVRDPGGWSGALGQFPGVSQDHRGSFNDATRARGERPTERGRAQQTIRRGARTADPGSRRLFTLPVLVASREGYKNLCRLVTEMKLRAPKGEGVLAIDELDGRVGGLVALIGRTAIDAPRFGVGGLVDRLVGIFGAGNVCMELQRHLLRDEESDNQALIELASAFHVPVIATNGVRFAEPADRPLYDVLTCIRHKTTLERAGRRLTWNAERYLKSPDVMARLFGDLPQAIAGARELANRLDYTMADLGYKFPEYPVPRGETMSSFLRKIVQAGARERYRPYHDRARRQVERELDLIEKLDLAGYFLIVWDIVNYCRQQDILVQGRGSAANSAVCYSLGITAVDPIGMDLLFERFLSEERGEWPDIDIDLPSGDRRERVIQHVYEKYGKLGAGMTANVITYRGRSAAREVGKTLSLEPAQVDRLAKVMNHFEWVDPKETLERNLREVGLDFHHPTIQLFGKLWGRIQDLPRHLGQHSGGMVICQGRLDEIVPLENASMPGRVVIQWDKDDCADMGLIKVDLLGLGMMAVLQDALTLVNRGSWFVNRGSDSEDSNGSERGATNNEPRATAEAVDLAHLPPNDPAVYKMLQEADTVGIFQVESRAQMATLPRLRPEKFYDIVVEVAIIRPGPIVGQMVHPYLKRRRGDEPVTYPHPSLQPILERTLGVPLFQEQLLRMAMVAAGFSGGEAEELRRAFGFKRSEHRMQQIETKLRAGMARQGITGDAAEEIIRSITSFALYGFPESHAASFALLVYASAYLKAHYPAAFYTAMLNNQPMGFYHPATLVKDAQRHGVHFAPIDVLESDWECRVEPDGRVRLGLMYVNGLREETGRLIASAGCPLSVVRRPLSERMASDTGVELETAMVRDSRLAARGSDANGGTNKPELAAPFADCCPKCGSDDPSMLEETPTGGFFCNICAHLWGEPASNGSPSLEPSGNDTRTTNCERRATAAANVAESREPSRNETRAANREWRTTAAANVAGSRELSGNGAQSPDPPPSRASESGALRRGLAEARRVSSSRRAEAGGSRTPRFSSIEDLIAKTRLRRDELATLAEIGALNAFGHHRRSALWQIEKAIRPAGELFAESSSDQMDDLDKRQHFSMLAGPHPRTGTPARAEHAPGTPPLALGGAADAALPSGAATPTRERVGDPGPSRGPQALGPTSEGSSRTTDNAQRTTNSDTRSAAKSPLRPMTPPERLMADYSGTSLTIGPHPLTLRRAELALRGVLRAIDLPRGRHGRRVRVAGAVITRQRPGTAKGFVFLTLEDETGIANIIVQPDLFSAEKLTIVGEPYLIVEGLLQIQEGVTSVKAERVLPLAGGPPPDSHDFR